MKKIRKEHGITMKKNIAMMIVLTIVPLLLLLTHPTKAERTEEKNKLEKLYQRNEELTKRYEAEAPRQAYYLLIGDKKARQEVTKKTTELKNEIIKIRREIREINRTRTLTLKEWLFDNSIAHPAACIQTRAEIIFVITVIICSILFILFVILFYPESFSPYHTCR